MDTQKFFSAFLRRVLFLSGVVVICWSPLLFAQDDEVDPDPFIAINRGVHKFNVALDTLIVKPVTICYDTVVPDVAKRGVTNFFNNIDDVTVIANDLLQLKLKNAVHDSGRLVLNTTVGIVGLIDVASDMGLYKNDEDFGQTLGYWGVGPGPYIEVPILGSFTLRDAFAYLPDRVTNPIWWVDKNTDRQVLYITDAIDTRYNLLAAESMISGDEYIFIRDAYLQRREYLVNDGVVYDEWDEF
jgi:phospholipid-binding lipoprotein MlaA